MKQTFLIFFSILSGYLMLANNKNKSESISNHAQLIDLNVHWKDKLIHDKVLNQKSLQKNDVELIQFHLHLVEKELRKSSPSHLNETQNRSRKLCLDILHQYLQRGLFPKNTNHSKRTPYFIDKYGTACAVGQLLISTGYGDLARKISKEHNYAYIKELSYTELEQWAQNHGFSIEELAWIQPSYLDPKYGDTSCIYSANISLTNGKKIFSIKWSNGDTTATAKNLCPKTFYSCQLRDSTGKLYSDSFYRLSSKFGVLIGDSIFIPEIKPFYISLSSTPDDGTCNGTATVKIILGDTSNGYGYYWFHSKANDTTQKNLCEGYYRVTATLLLGPMSYANIFDSVKVHKGTSNIVESNEVLFKIFPNPLSSFCVVSLPFNIDEAEIEIYQISGAKLISKSITPQNNQIDISHLQKGIYYYNIIYKDKIQNGKLFIE